MHQEQTYMEHLLLLNVSELLIERCPELMMMVVVCLQASVGAE